MRILICYWQFPEYDRHSGALRLIEIIRLLLSQGHQITFFADHRASVSDRNKTYKKQLLNLGIECFEKDIENKNDYLIFNELLNIRQFNIALLSHYFIYNDYASILRNFQPNCHLILDTVDLHFLRKTRQANIQKSEELFLDAENTRKNEFRAIENADSIWVVSENEKDFLLKYEIKSDSHIFVIPNIHRELEDTLGYEKRDGIIFIGGYKFAPNIDAIDFFMSEILPLFKNTLLNVKFSIAGCSPPDHFPNYNKIANVNITGFVKDHKALLNSHRVAVAPLRFGAGMKGKIGEYLCCGLPVVTTTVGAEGFGFNDNEVIIADNSKDFANGIIHLYCNKEIWESYRNNGVSFMKRFSPESIGEKLKRIINKYCIDTEDTK